MNGDFEIDDSEATIAGIFTDSQIDDDEILLRGTSVLTVNTGADINSFDDIEFRNNDGISRLIINGGILSIEDDIDLRPGSTDGDFIEVNGGTLDVGDNIAITDNNANSIIINPGGTVTSSTVDGAVITDPDDLPDGIILNGGDVGVGGNPLPGTFTSFSSYYNKENNSVNLVWNTASEINNHGFYIERSPFDTLVFEEIGFVEGNGDSNEPINYTFTDKNAFSSYYYRLRQVDFDGAFEFSSTIFSKLEIQEFPDFKLGIYPNPSSGSNLTIQGSPNVQFSATLHSIEGKELINVQVANVKLIERLINNSLQNTNPGIYVLNYTNGTMRKSLRIVRK